MPNPKVCGVSAESQQIGGGNVSFLFDMYSVPLIRLESKLGKFRFDKNLLLFGTQYLNDLRVAFPSKKFKGFILEQRKRVFEYAVIILLYIFDQQDAPFVVL